MQNWYFMSQLTQMFKKYLQNSNIYCDEWSLFVISEQIVWYRYQSDFMK